MTVSEGMVSVIIPSYNRSRLCRQAVSSVLSQTYANVEVIVVDDGSTDDTEQVISGMDERVRYIRQENAGVSAARNRGLEAARGELIAFLDSDDLWLPWKLEAQVGLLEAFPDVGMVWTDMIAVDANGAQLHGAYLKRMYGAYSYFNPDDHFAGNCRIGETWHSCPEPWRDRRCYVGNIYPWMFMGNLVHTSTVVLRRERQRSVGGFDVTLLRSGEDYDFHFRTCRSGDVAYMDISSIRYRIGAEDQLTSKELMVWMARNNLKTILNALSTSREEITLPESMIRKRVASSYAWVGIAEFTRDHKSARWYLRNSLKTDPRQARAAVYCLLSMLPRPVAGLALKVKRGLSRARREN